MTNEVLTEAEIGALVLHLRRPRTQDSSGIRAADLIERLLAENHLLKHRASPPQILDFVDPQGEYERLLNVLTNIACMDCYTRVGEDMPHIRMMALAREAVHQR